MQTTDAGLELTRLLDPLLDRADEATKALLMTLEEERDALAHRDRDAIEALAKRKQAESRELDTLGRHMAQALHRFGIHHQGAGAVERDLEAQGHTGLATAWQDFRARVDRCRDLNLANGRAIALSHRTAQRLLDLLRGTDSRTRLYGPQGHHHGSGHSGYITKA